MYDILMRMSGEWKPKIMLFLFFFFWLVLICAVVKARRHPDMYDRVGKTLAWYLVLGMWFCQCIVDIGLKFMGVMLVNFTNALWVSIIMLCINTLFAASFFYSLCRMACFFPGGLRLARIFLVIIPIFFLVFPFSCFIFASAVTGEPYDIRIYMRFNKYSILMSCMFSIPWLLYFCFSSTIKNIFLSVEAAQRNS